MPPFQRHIFVCTNQRPKDDPRGCCANLGSETLHAHFKSETKRLNLKGLVRANKAGCLDHCELGPSVVIYPEGVWYWVGTEADVTEIMERHVIKGEIVTRLLMPDHPVPDRLDPIKKPQDFSTIISMPTEDKWKANMEKVAFTRQFPGLLLDWKLFEGKTIQAVIPLTGKPGAAVVICSDATFAVVPALSPEPWTLGQALVDARARLEPAHRTAYAEYDRLAKKDKDALRSARLGKILGAIHNNLEQIPELKERLKELVKEWK